MAQLIKRFQYAPQQDVIELYAPNLVRVNFGVITENEADNTAETLWVKSCFDEMKQLVQPPLKILINLSTIDSGEFNSKESNRLYREMLKDAAISQVAVYGLHPGWQLLIDVLRVFVPNKLRTFATEDQALAWLEVSNAAN
jgi:hypothetical protein